jgi:hypothetical protein
MPFTVYLRDNLTGSTNSALTSHTADSGATWPSDSTHAVGANAIELDGSGGMFLSGGDSANISSAAMPTGDFEVICGLKRNSAVTNSVAQLFLFSPALTSFSQPVSLCWMETGAIHPGLNFLDSTGSPLNGSPNAGPSVGVEWLIKVRVTGTAGATTSFSASYSTDGGVTYSSLGIDCTRTTPTSPLVREVGPYLAGGAVSSSTGPHLMGPLIVQDLSATTATLSGPTSGTVSAQSTAFTVTLNNPAGYGGVTVTPASSVGGDTFQATSGGGNVTTITIAQGASSGTFYLTPSSTSGSRNVSITTSPVLTYSGSPSSYSANPAVPSATRLILTGPTGGLANVASRTFAITPDGSASCTATVTITGGGLSTTVTKTFSSSNTPQTFTITPTAAGVVSLTPSNNGSLANSPAWNYTVATVPTHREVFSVVRGFAPGLSTVGYTVYRPDNSVHSVSGLNRNTYGVVELGSGAYGARIPLPTAGQYTIQWDDGGSPTPKRADDPISPIGVEAGYTLEQAIALIMAESVNKASGNFASGTSSPVFTAPDGTTTRVSGSSDQNGNRTSVLSPPV